MAVDTNLDQNLHGRLPIGDKEQIVAVYKHSSMAYLQIWLTAAVLIVVLVAGAIVATTVRINGNTMVSSSSSTLVVAIVVLLSVMIIGFAYVPIWMKMHESLVLTDEAITQALRTGLFVDKISQLSLEHVADVSVQRDLMGRIFSYGKIVIETPGEQEENYEFDYLHDPYGSAKQIIETHENFAAALQAGHVESTFRAQAAVGQTGYDNGLPSQAAVPQQQTVAVDQQQYEQFIAYQHAQQGANTFDPTVPSSEQNQPIQNGHN